MAPWIYLFLHLQCKFSAHDVTSSGKISRIKVRFVKLWWDEVFKNRISKYSFGVFQASDRFDFWTRFDELNLFGQVLWDQENVVVSLENKVDGGASVFDEFEEGDVLEGQVVVALVEVEDEQVVFCSHFFG